MTAPGDYWMTADSQFTSQSLRGSYTPLTFRSAWMEPDGGGTMSASSGCGWSLKYEEGSLHASETLRDAQEGGGPLHDLL